MTVFFFLPPEHSKTLEKQTNHSPKNCNDCILSLILTDIKSISNSDLTHTAQEKSIYHH